MHRLVLLGLLAVLTIQSRAWSAEKSTFSTERLEDRVLIKYRKQPLATYMFKSDVIKRPFFMDVFAPDGTRLTRQWPPKKGEDPVDHADQHGGIWLAFGDISGVDFWRNKGEVRQVSLTLGRPEQAGLRFSASNEFRSPTGELMCRQTTQYMFGECSQGVLLDWTSVIEPVGEPIVFGDQEEMGLGVRLATPLTVTHGGDIVDAHGHRDERGVWGKQAAWCEYRKQVESTDVGIAIFTSPKNFRQCWFHVRDYGLMVANPFGRNAFTKQAPSQVVVKRDRPLQLRFGILLSATKSRRTDVIAAYKRFLDLEKNEAAHANAPALR